MLAWLLVLSFLVLEVSLSHVACTKPEGRVLEKKRVEDWHAKFWWSIGRWIIDARKWFKGPTINLTEEERAHVHLEREEQDVQADDIERSHKTVDNYDDKDAEVSEKETVSPTA